jgi:uncharacterized membrane protein
MAKEEDDPTTSEDRLGRHIAFRSSTWSSLIVIVIIALIVGAVFYLSR